MRVLIACEFSGVVREAFRKLGHDAWSCDLRPADDKSHFHIQGDCLAVLNQGWDLMIGHPPCTHLALAGNRWLKDHWVKRKKKPDRWHDGSAKREAQKQSVEFFKALLNAPIPMICIENPMSQASRLVAPKTQTIHPWQFGHPEQKTTWLWLKNLPHLRPTKNVHAEMMLLPKSQRERIWSMPPGPQREKMRSVTFQGIADAMAQQWGDPMADPLL
jgi:hypothetical protein